MGARYDCYLLHDVHGGPVVIDAENAQTAAAQAAQRLEIEGRWLAVPRETEAHTFTITSRRIFTAAPDDPWANDENPF